MFKERVFIRFYHIQGWRVEGLKGTFKLGYIEIKIIYLFIFSKVLYTNMAKHPSHPSPLHPLYVYSF